MTGGFTELGMRFLRWKTICAAAMFAPLFAIAQQQPSDYAREKRWADEIVPQLVSGARKSTRLNSSHRCSSYDVFCLKKKIALAGRLASQRISEDRLPTS